MIVNCPTGLAIEIRKLKTKELDFLIDRKKLKTPFANKLLTECVTSILNPGFYQYTPGTPFDWVKATVADRTAALIGIRQATYKDFYDFDLNCQDQFCRKRIKWSVNISDMPYEPLSAETLALFQAGNRAEYTLSDGTRIVYKVLLTGEDADEAEKQLEKLSDRQLTVALAVRIVSIQGVDERRKLDWLGDMDADELESLKNELNKADGGYDNTFLVKCEHCEAEQQVFVPFDRTFFLPRRGTSSSTAAQNSASPSTRRSID